MVASETGGRNSWGYRHSCIDVQGRPQRSGTQAVFGADKAGRGQSNDNLTETILICHLIILPGVEGHPPFISLTYAVQSCQALMDALLKRSGVCAVKDGTQVLRGLA